MKFSSNYEKLNWVIFTTIRKNTGRYKLGKIYKIDAPSRYKKVFEARVIGLLPIKKKEMTDDLARVDADATKEELIKILESWYGKAFDDYVLITLWSNSVA